MASVSVLDSGFRQVAITSFDHCHICGFQTSSNVENLHPQIIKQVSKELTSLTNDPPEGIKVFVNEQDITDIQATIEGPGTVFLWCFCFWNLRIFSLYRAAKWCINLPCEGYAFTPVKLCIPLIDRHPRLKSQLECFPCLFLAGTPYEGGLFRVKLVLGKDYPTAPPKGELKFILIKINKCFWA